MTEPEWSGLSSDEPKVQRYHPRASWSMLPIPPTDHGEAWYSQADYEALEARVEELKALPHFTSTCSTHGEITMGAACHHCLDDSVAEIERLRELCKEALVELEYLGGCTEEYEEALAAKEPSDD